MTTSNHETIKTLVIKVGTSCLVHENGSLNFKKMELLARVLTDLVNREMHVVLVSSGAIGCGRKCLGMVERPKCLEEKQMAAAVGQGLLMELYHKFFSEYHQNIGQILLTKDVFTNVIKRQNAKNTFSALLNCGIIPIVNENDCISTDQIQEEAFGDNDSLSAMTAVLVDADLLMILSDVDGLYDRDPSKHADAKRLSVVQNIDEGIEAMAGFSATNLGTGGMFTKIKAAKYTTSHGIETVIASGDRLDVIYDLLEGKSVGTLFTISED